MKKIRICATGGYDGTASCAIWTVCRKSCYVFAGHIREDEEVFNPARTWVLNTNQIPSNYVPVGTMTMSKRGEKSVPVKGLSDKRNITLTFQVTLSGEFLPMQIIYQGKTDRSQPRGFEFPDGFSVTQNPKHWSNETETLKLGKLEIRYSQ